MQKPAREQGRNTELESHALTYVRASAQKYDPAPHEKTTHRQKFDSRSSGGSNIARVIGRASLVLVGNGCKRQAV